MHRRHLARTLLTALNGTTGAGLLLALATGTRIRRGPGGVLIAEGYRRSVPPATCFTVGSVIITRRTADWLLAPERARLFDHESRHAGQYAAFGPLFWPAYWLSCGWSYALTGSYGARNAFERHAGLATGGYRELPLRPWAARLTRPAAGPTPAGPPNGTTPAHSRAGTAPLDPPAGTIPADPPAGTAPLDPPAGNPPPR